jgi:uncharacterized protein with HEPN domain
VPRDVHVYLQDILDACEKIRRYTGEMTLDQFGSDDKTVDAVIRNLEIIGEAARQVPSEIRAATSAIEWQRIAAMRNVLIHAYFGVDVEIVWDVITTKVPEMQSALRQLLDSR